MADKKKAQAEKFKEGKAEEPGEWGRENGLLAPAPGTSQVRHDNGAPKETISSRFVVLRPPSLNGSFGATRRRGYFFFVLYPGFRGENGNGSPLTLGYYQVTPTGF